MANGTHGAGQPQGPEQPEQVEPPQGSGQPEGPEQPQQRNLWRDISVWASRVSYGVGGAIAGLSAFDYAITNWRVDSLPHLAGNIAIGAGFYFLGRGLAGLSQEPRITEEEALRQFVEEVQRGPVELPDGGRLTYVPPQTEQPDRRGRARRAWDRTAEGIRRVTTRGTAGYFGLGLAAWIAAAGAYTAIKPWKYMRDEGIPAAISFTAKEAAPTVSNVAKYVYYSSTGLKSPVERTCRYDGEPDGNEKRIMQGLFPHDMYVPVRLNCRPERVLAGLEYSGVQDIARVSAAFGRGDISEVELADSRPGVYKLGTKTYVWSPTGFHRER